MVDVLIVGGGIAGSALAILLGRSGVSCELLEQGQFPKDKPCGEGLMPGGVAVLRRLALADAIGGAPFDGVRYHCASHVAEGRFPRKKGQPEHGIGQRRIVLDHLLYEAAAATTGVTAQCGVRVECPLLQNGRVTGVSVAGEGRHARLVVAADGIHSRMRRSLGLDAPARRKRLGARAHFRLSRGQQQLRWVEVFVAAGHEFYVTPLPNNEVLVALLANAETLREPVERVFSRWIHEERVLAARLEGAEQISALLCSSPLAARARAGVAPGVVLLGDAAGFVDPITGGGMSQALMTAELLSRYIRHGLHDTDSWSWSFEKERGRLLKDYITLTQAILWLAAHPLLARNAVGALRALPGLLSHLVGVSAGSRALFSAT
jgi:flavin-dependent dehydrogenase